MTAMADWCVLLSDAPKAKEKRKKSLFHAWGVQRLFLYATLPYFHRFKFLKTIKDKILESIASGIFIPLSKETKYAQRTIRKRSGYAHCALCRGFRDTGSSLENPAVPWPWMARQVTMRMDARL